MLQRRRENTFKKYLVSTLLKDRGHIQSIEDKHSAGIPDLNHCFQGVEGWTELKAIQRWPKDPSTTLHTPLKHLTFEQCNWLHRRYNAGGFTFLFMKVVETKDYLLFNGHNARVLKECTQTEAYALAIYVWQGSINPNQLIELLRGNEV